MSAALSSDAAAVLQLVRERGPQHGKGIETKLAMGSDRRRAAVDELRRAGLIETAKGSVLRQRERGGVFVFEPGKPPAPIPNSSRICAYRWQGR